MKRFVMKQKLLSWGDDFTIKDENGTVILATAVVVDLVCHSDDRNRR